jgi:hypothetical protein
VLARLDSEELEQKVGQFSSDRTLNK